MVQIKTILVPTDFSDASAAALDFARALAGAFESDLHLLHVVQDRTCSRGRPRPSACRWPACSSGGEQDAHAQLEQLVPEAERQARPVQCATRVGHPFVEILSYAQAHHVDLIVMGTHGAGPSRTCCSGA